jgi:hypothetical protein
MLALAGIAIFRRCRDDPAAPIQQYHCSLCAGPTRSSNAAGLKWTSRLRALQRRASACGTVRALLCGAATLFRDRERDVTAQLVVGDSKNTITLARSSADVSPPYGFMLLPGTTSSGFAMKRPSFSLSHTKSAPFMALE